MTTATPHLPAPGSVGAWWLAARPRTLPVAVAPVLVGAAVAMHVAPALDAASIAAALLGAILLQIGANLANDAFDFEKGTDDARRIGPPRAAQAGLLTPGTLKKGMAFVFALATICGVFLASRHGIAIVAVGAASIASAIAYTGGPYPLGYNGLGDLFVFLFFGPVAVVGTTFVAGGGVHPLALAASVPVGALATAVLVVNNVRDHETDVTTGKRTLVVRLGRRFGVLEYRLLLALAALAPVLFAASGVLPRTVLFSLATLPRLVRLSVAIGRETDGAALTRVLADTAALLVVWAALFAVGIRIGAA
jgi:1,4-dihydroxy-2-naphthoate octaprenyltransferase